MTDTEPTEGALPYVETNDGLADFTADDFTLHPDAEALPDLSHLPVPPPPPELGAGQDDGADEGRGAGGPAAPFVRATEAALAIAVGYVKSRTRVTPGYCLRETRLYFNVSPYYLAAKDSLAGAKAMGVAHRVAMTAEAVKRIPRGTITYFMGPRSQYGHVGPSVGAGFMVSTDWPTGYYGRVNILTLAQAWGYTEIWWAPVVNDVRVWKRTPKPQATPLVTRWNNGERSDKLLARLAADGDGAHPEEVKAAAARIIAGRADRERAQALHDRAARRTKAGRQALRELEVPK